MTLHDMKPLTMKAQGIITQLSSLQFYGAFLFFLFWFCFGFGDEQHLQLATSWHLAANELPIFSQEWVETKKGWVIVGHQMNAYGPVCAVC